jgi:phosphoribosyl 1,2-cyclic phosphodiesterase
VLGLARTVRERIRRGNSLNAYLSRPTAELIDWQGLERPPVKHFTAGEKFQIGDLGIMPISILHDCVDPVAFVVTDRYGAKAVVAVDMGSVPEALTWYAKGAQIVLIESNHDTELLRNGAYPEHLKKRITSDVGHLSNQATRNWIRREMDSATRHLVLGHLSRQNNHPDLVREGAAEALASRGMKNCSLSIATYQSATPVIEV